MLMGRWGKAGMKAQVGTGSGLGGPRGEGGGGGGWRRKSFGQLMRHDDAARLCQHLSEERPAFSADFEYTLTLPSATRQTAQHDRLYACDPHVM